MSEEVLLGCVINTLTDNRMDRLIHMKEEGRRDGSRDDLCDNKEDLPSSTKALHTVKSAWDSFPPLPPPSSLVLGLD